MVGQTARVPREEERLRWVGFRHEAVNFLRVARGKFRSRSHITLIVTEQGFRITTARFFIYLLTYLCVYLPYVQCRLCV